MSGWVSQTVCNQSKEFYHFSPTENSLFCELGNVFQFVDQIASQKLPLTSYKNTDL